MSSQDKPPKRARDPQDPRAHFRDKDRFRTFGRAKGRPLSPAQNEMMDRAFPALRWEVGGPLPDAPLWLEIGFGGAEHMLWQAAQNPDAHIVGAEPFLNGVMAAVRGADESSLTNLSIHHGDVRDVMAALPDNCLTRAFILFPDPWHKTRHHKRRLIQDDFLVELHRVLKPDAILRFASDINHYVDWALTRIDRHGGFHWQAKTHGDWTERAADWPGTRYEAKAIREGRTPQYFEFRAR